MQEARRQHLLDKLVRELVRAEARAIEHARREARRLGAVPPVAALHAVAHHAHELGPRLARVLGELGLEAGGTLAGRWSELRQPAADRTHDAERAYHAVLRDLGHAVDVVRVLREVARLEEMFALIRWCDDWLACRRPLVTRANAELAWFAAHPQRQAVPVGDRRANGSHGDHRPPGSGTAGQH